ncbi:MAG: tRNA uridine-5-carboxymethylaminomethyl(34) synthesis GTPase MnmE [Oscillibacter sp.]|nr:tRNA uridine-5-carboxymethylaminomethyl(34) synthesis GTPase MnmE [Oscillibacter sp.]
MSEPIAAIATGQSRCAIGIIRVSGDGCFAVCERVFRADSGKPFASLPPRTMSLGSLSDAGGAAIDRALAVRFPAPHSYTGEDCAEFHCHGSPIVLREVLLSLFQAGARQATAGEFTKRAFLNARLDLTEAEAVIDLIDAETAAAARNAAAQLDGALSRVLEPIQETLLDVAARFYAVVDYPDEDIEDTRPEEIADALSRSGAALDNLLGACRRGRVLKSGVKTAIIGRPNAGKSSLFNALAGFERVIVTEIPGTTRDTVEESVVCGGVLLRLTDTAGLRDASDAAERLGVERSRKAVADADLVFVVADASAAPTEEDADAVRLARESGKPWIFISNKRDLPQNADFDAWENAAQAAHTVRVSAKTGDGLSELERVVGELFPVGDAAPGALLTDQRQEDAARRARDALSRAQNALQSGFTPDAVLTDAEDALDAVGELTGRTAKEELVSHIFSRFCVGK